MVFANDETSCHLSSDLEYTEQTLQEAITITRQAFYDARQDRNNFLFEEYVSILTSLTNNLTALAGAQISVKANKTVDLEGRVLQPANESLPKPVRLYTR
jgi:hypothetical protein